MIDYKGQVNKGQVAGNKGNKGYVKERWGRLRDILQRDRVKKGQVAEKQGEQGISLKRDRENNWEVGLKAETGGKSRLQRDRENLLGEINLNIK